MRYRAMTPEGDYVFGPASRFLADTPECVAQAVMTRVRLFVGEWFLDSREGLDRAQILGYGTQQTRDAEIKERILGTQGVTRIAEYSSRVDATTRSFTVACTIDTAFGQAAIAETIR